MSWRQVAAGARSAPRIWADRPAPRCAAIAGRTQGSAGSWSAPPGDAGGVCNDDGGRASRAGWDVDGELVGVIDRRGGEGLAGGVVAKYAELERFTLGRGEAEPRSYG